MDKLIRQRLSQRLGTLAALVLLAVPGLAAQTGTIAGRVIDAGSTLPIPAAQVFIADLDLGVLSQQNGSYILLNVPVGPRTVTVQRIGYRQVTQTVTVAAGQTAVLDFRITEEALQLDEIIITGTPGGTQRRAIGNAVSSVDVTDVVQDVSISGVQDLLTGRTPGVQFTRLSGNVGQGSPVRVRGIGSFTDANTNPLVYIDGVRVNNDVAAGPTVGGGDGVSVLDDINPEDIESIEIIKGPAAASLYGTEASAGVIQIITKRGREGAPVFNVSIRQGVNYMRDPAGRLGEMWYCPYDQSPLNAGGSEIYFGVAGVPTGTDSRLCNEASELVPYNMYDEANEYIREGYFPWPSDNLYQNGPVQSYNLDVSGGTQAISYFLSTNYDKEEGYVWYNHDETFRLRANVGVVFSELFSLDVSTSYVDGFTRFGTPTPGDGGEWQDMVWSNGTFLNDNIPFGTQVTQTNGTVRTIGDPRLGGFQEKLPNDVGENESNREYNRFTGSATMRFQTGDVSIGGMTASLTQRAVVGIDKQWDINQNIFPIEDGTIPAHLVQYYVNLPTYRWKEAYPENAEGTAAYERPITTNLSFDYALSTNLRVNDSWAFTTSAGAQYNVRQSDQFSNAGTGYATAVSRTINQIQQAKITTSYSDVTNKGLGFYVQEEINYGDRIFLTGAIRFDDNSTFGADAPSQSYPKLSASWVVSDESFWNFDFINSLRVRGAWGKSGRQPSSIAGFNVYAASAGPLGGAGIRPSGPGNPGVEPEVSTELELGFEFSMLEDRISGEFTHYNKKNEQVLQGIPFPGSYGFPGNVDTNIGRIDNWGWEAQLSTRLYESDLVSLDVDWSADHTDNEIKSLCNVIDGTEKCYAGTATIGIGNPYPIQTINYNVSHGAWQGEADYDPASVMSNHYAQSLTAYCYPAETLAPRDASGQASADSLRYGKVFSDTPILCSATSPWLRGGFAGRSYATYTYSIAPRITLFENALQIFAMAQGEYGRTREESAHTWTHNYYSTYESKVQTNGGWVASNNLNSTSADTYYKGLYDGDFWKLREVGLRYNLPDSWVGVTGASRASLAVSMRNPYTIWQRQKRILGNQISDPEFGTAGLTGDGNFYEVPPLSTISVTLRATF
jgi:TonB-linked SusC/RagA family outer membrane protein